VTQITDAVNYNPDTMQARYTPISEFKRFIQDSDDKFKQLRELRLTLFD
jgi:hypothetical protein